MGALIYLPYSDGQTVKCDEQVIYQNNRFAKAQGIEFIEIVDGYIVFSLTPSEDTNLHFEVK